MPIKLRDYQNDCVAAVRRDIATGSRRVAAVLPTGGGKTVIFSEFIRQELAERGGRALVLVHRDELASQAVDKYQSVDPKAKVGIVKANRNDVHADVVVGSVQTLRGAARREALDGVSLGVVDECFPAGTLVGGRPIETLRVGDLVPSYDERTGRPVTRRVTAVMTRRPSALVRVATEGGRSIVCTPEHPFLTLGGWVTAERLRGASVLSFTHDADADMHGVRGNVRGGTEGEDRRMAQVGARLLSGLLPGRMGAPRSLGAHVCDEPSARLGTDATAQPDAQRDLTRGNVRDAAPDRTQAERARRQRQGGTRTGASARRAVRLADGGSDRAAGRRTSVSLPGGHRAPVDDGRGGGGRRLARTAGATGQRRTQGFTTDLDRVVSVQILEPGRDGTYGGVCRGGVVFNLEVEGTHTYLIGDGVVVHNCHHATAASYRTVMGHYDVPWLGVTATLARSDGARLGDVWQKVSYNEMTVLRMIRKGYLVDVKGVQVKVPDLDLTGLHKTAGDYREGELGERLMDSLAPQAVVQAYTEHGVVDGRILPGIVFCPTVETAHVFAEAFTAAGFRTAAVWGAMPMDQRRQVLRDYDEGRLDVLTNCMVLTEGFDSPRAQVAVIARPTQSSPLYVQMVGRVLRPFPGKSYALVLDVVGVASRLELATLAELGGETVPKEQREGTVRSLLEEFGKPCTTCDAFEQECDPHARCCDGCSHWLARDGEDTGYVGPLEMREVDLFGGSRQQWLQTHAGHWFVPAGNRLIAILPADSGYDVAWFTAAKRGGGWIARGVTDLGYAMAQGEGEITSEEETLAKKDGRWRRGRPSAKQINYAMGLGAQKDGQRLGAEVLAGLRMGEVADLISVAIASRRIDPAVRGRS